MLVCPTLAIQHCMMQWVVQCSMGVNTDALFRASHTVQLSVYQLSCKHAACAMCIATNPQPSHCSNDTGVNRHCVLRHLHLPAFACTSSTLNIVAMGGEMGTLHRCCLIRCCVRLFANGLCQVAMMIWFRAHCHCHPYALMLRCACLCCP